MEAQVSVRNLTGNAERYDLNLEYGQQKSSTFKLSVVRPRWMGTDATLSADVSKSAISNLKHSSFVQKLLGGGVGCRVNSAESERGGHEFGASFYLRDVCKLPTGVASWPILQQRGASVKAALTHSYALNRLDHPLVPSSGGAVRLSTELAGVLPPLGDARFVKQTLTASLFTPLIARLTFGCSLHAGLLLPLGGGGGGPPSETNICDRFYLGGPGSFWGFRTRGLGPREHRHNPTGEPPGPKTPRDSLGGDVMAVATAALSMPLPGERLEAANARAHVFASAGGLQSMSGLNADGSLMPSVRACVGAGLAVPTAVGRVELNATHVLRRRPEDAVVRHCVQIGITPGYA